MADEPLTSELMDSIERRIEDLRNQFEQYFMGIRKRAPLQERTNIQYLIRRISNQKITNTRLRFRFEQAVAKFNAYNQYWNRTMSQIEAGTYYRDRFKTQLHTGPIDEAPSAPKPTPKKKEAGELSEDHINKIYKEYIEARKKLNQPANISKDKLAASMKKQLPALKEKYKGKNVEFKVVIEDGKAKLKATIK